MQTIEMNFTNDTVLTRESASHIERAELCRDVICDNRSVSDKKRFIVNQLIFIRLMMEMVDAPGYV